MPDDADTPDLGDLLRTGAVLFGVRVTAVRIETADGRVQRLMLPEPAGESGGAVDTPDQFDPERLTPMQRDVVQAVDEMLVGTVLSYAELADKAGVGNGGRFREFVKQYAEGTGRLESTSKGWEKLK